MKSARKQLYSEFWESQRNVENEWVDNFNKVQLEKHRKQVIKRKESVIKISKATSDHLDWVRRRDEDAQNRADLRAAKKAEKVEMISKWVDRLNVESENWITKENYHEKITEELIIPEAIHSTSYYEKLRQKSYLSELGSPQTRFDGFNNRAETKLRNSFLFPIFIEIKSAVKHLTWTEQHKLEHEFKTDKALLLLEDIPKVEEVPKLRDLYKNLAKAQLDQETQEAKLQKLYDYLRTLQTLLLNWQKYINIAQMDETGLHQFSVANAKASGIINEEDFAAQDSVVKWDDDFTEGAVETSDAFEHMEGEEDENDPEFAEDDEVGMEVTRMFQDHDTDQDNMYTGAISDDANPDYIAETKLDEKSVFDKILQEIRYQQPMLEEFFGKIPEDVEESNKEVADMDAVYNPSMVMEKLRAKIEAIPEENLQLQEKYHRFQILESIQRIQSIEIDEPQLLYQVFKFHRYDPVSFD